MPKYTNYYIAGVRDGKKTKVFEKNLHKAVLAARKIGMKFSSEDAFGFDAETKKWEKVSKLVPRKETARRLVKAAAKVTPKTIDKAPKELIQPKRKVTATSLIKKGTEALKTLAKKTNFVIPAVKLLGERIKTEVSEFKAIGMRKELLRKFSNDLPSTIMGADNYNRAVRTIEDFLKTGNYVAASNYMVSQLFKLEKETRGTGSNKYVADKLGNWYGRHLTFPEK